MELYDEELEQKKSKAPMIIGICIAILLILTIVIIYGIIYLQNSITIVKIDGVKKIEMEEMLYIESAEEGRELYFPIKQIAPLLGSEAFDGDFKNKSEDKTKCYVENQYEVVMFSLNSEVLVKIIQDAEYEYIELEKPVFEKDGELYTSVEGIEKAFNILISYDEDFKNIELYSMDYLIEFYAKNLKIEDYSTKFEDKKAIFESMLIIKNDEKYGVIKIDDQGNSIPILETKYEEINFLPITSDFLVKSNGKYGIVTKDANIKIKTIYDSIKIMDNEIGLYLVQQNNVYGVVDASGKVIIEPEHKQIGIDIDKYTQNGVENKYIILDEIIPIKNEQGLWGFYNIKGEKVIDFKYSSLGSKQASVTNSYPVLVIPSSKIIVVESDNHYNLITVTGEELIPGFILDEVYLKTDVMTEQNEYYMTYNNNDKVINIEEWLTSIGR